MPLICPQCLRRFDDGTERCEADGSELLRASGKRSGTLVADRFLILDRIGSGGMGNVYRAYQRSVGRIVALKLLRNAMADEDGVERFRREAQAMGRLKSPYTVAVYDFGEVEDGELFLAMEFVPGPTVRGVLDRLTRLAPKRAARLVADATHSLEEAHGQGLVHRDIKPGNILIESVGTPEERARVLDFGVAKIMDSGAASLTHPRGACGTPAYMSAEQCRATPVTPASDQYSLGVVLFEMVSGSRPFGGESSTDVMWMHARQRPPDLETFFSDPRITPLADVVRRTLEKDPEGRFASMPELREALLAAVADLEPDWRPHTQLPPHAAAPTVDGPLDDAGGLPFADTRIAAGRRDTEEGDLAPASSTPSAGQAIEQRDLVARRVGTPPVALVACVVVAIGLAAGLYANAPDPTIISAPMPRAAAPRPAPEAKPPAAEAPAPTPTVSSAPEAAPPTPAKTAPPPAPASAAPPPKRRPKRWTPRPTIIGALPREDAQRTLRALAAPVRRCERGSSADARLFMIVLADGSVRSVHVRPDTAGDKKALACLENAAKALRFDPFSGPGFATVELPLHADP